MLYYIIYIIYINRQISCYIYSNNTTNSNNNNNIYIYMYSTWILVKFMVVLSVIWHLVFRGPRVGP